MASSSFDSSSGAAPSPRVRLTIDEALRGVAGTFVTLSVALGYFVHPAFLLFTVFVGLNLLQSAFTRSCPMMTILRKAGLPEIRR